MGTLQPDLGPLEYGWTILHVQMPVQPNIALLSLERKYIWQKKFVAKSFEKKPALVCDIFDHHELCLLNFS